MDKVKEGRKQEKGKGKGWLALLVSQIALG